MTVALFLLSVSLGNAFTSLVNYFIQNDDGSVWLEGPDYYWFFTWVMLGVSILFIAVANPTLQRPNLSSGREGQG